MVLLVVSQIFKDQDVDELWKFLEGRRVKAAAAVAAADTSSEPTNTKVKHVTIAISSMGQRINHLCYFHPQTQQIAHRYAYAFTGD